MAVRVVGSAIFGLGPRRREATEESGLGRTAFSQGVKCVRWLDMSGHVGASHAQRTHGTHIVALCSLRTCVAGAPWRVLRE